MNVSLTPQLERMVARRVKSGMYQTASEVVREALRLLEERDSFGSLRRDIQQGIDDLEHGRYTDYDGRGLRRLAKEIKARGRRRLAALAKAS